MKFSVITPTYRRRDLLDRAIDSLISQKYQNWEMIVVNDSPDDVSYDDVYQEKFEDSRIRYYVNKENSGVNYSRNKALDLISSDSTHVIFLDDDDYLSADALDVMADSLRKNPDVYWLVTNRCGVGSGSYTKAPVDNRFYNYATDYLICRRIKGDATHCIASNKIKGIRFPTTIKQAEEWLFYMELGRICSLYYQNIDTTYTDGYSESGLNVRSRQFSKELVVMKKIFREARMRGLLTNLYFYIYYQARILRLVLRTNILY